MFLNPPRVISTCAQALVLFALTEVRAAQGPPLRTGLWMIQKISDAAADPGRFESSIKANPHLSGVCLGAGWGEIETESGRPDFTQIDKAVEVLRRVGMKYQLGIKPGIDTPSFVYADGAQSFQTRITNPHRANAGGAATIPVPWDTVYQRHFSQLIAQLGEHYASDPLCVSIVLTSANFMSKEMHLPKTPEDKAKWSALGDYSSKLVEVYRKYTDAWAQAFPKQEVSLHISQVLDLPPSFFDKIIDYGLSQYPERFSIQNDQLTGRSEDIGIMSYDLVLKYRDRIHHGFQSAAGFSRGGERMGSIEMATLNVVHAKGEYWELWHGDGLNAQTSAAVASAWEEVKKLGYDDYKKKLISQGAYRTQESDRHGSGGRRRLRGL